MLDLANLASKPPPLIHPIKGGHFFKLAKQLVDPFMQMEQSAQESRQTHEPRKYQQELVDGVIGWHSTGQAAIVVSAPGTGKTKVATDVHQEIINREPSAKAVYFADKVHLALQLVRAIKSTVKSRHGNRLRVDVWRSPKPQSKQPWEEILSNTDAIVATPAYFLNFLESQGATLDKIAYVVFDEVHHMEKDHPYVRVLEEFKAQVGPLTKAKLKMTGLTASLPGAQTVEQTESKIDDLTKRMCAQLVTVQEHKEELLRHTPQAAVIEAPVDSRPVDRWFENSCASLYKGIETAKRDLPDSLNEAIARDLKQIKHAQCIADDCGVGEALRFLAARLLSSWRVLDVSIVIEILQKVADSKLFDSQMMYSCVLAYMHVPYYSAEHR